MNYDFPQGSELSWNGRYDKNWQEFYINNSLHFLIVVRVEDFMVVLVAVTEDNVVF